MTYSFLALTGLAALLLVYIATRGRGGLMIKDYFIVFVLIMYGPQICFWDGFDESIAPLISPDIHQRYLFGLTVAYLSMSFGWLAAHLYTARQMETAQVTPGAGHSLPTPWITAPYFALAWVFVIVAFEGFSFEKLRTIFDYASGSGNLAYTEIREDLFDDRVVDAITRLTRYNITAFLFCMTVGSYIATRRNMVLTVTACLLLFMVCAIEIKKFIWIYYILLAALTTYHVLAEIHGKAPLSKRAIVFVGLTAIALLGVLVIALYFFQYRSQAEEGDFNLFDAMYVTVYRIFLIYQDVLLLYFFVYPDVLPHLDGSGIQLLMNLLGGEFRDPTIEVPVVALNARTTSFPAGFIASGYADFGLVGIAFSGGFVGMLVVFLSNVVRRINEPIARGVFTAMVGLSMHHIPATPLHTALLSGGVISAPIMIWLFTYFRPRLREQGLRPGRRAVSLHSANPGR